MVVESIDSREKTANAIIRAVQEQGDSRLDAEAIAKTLESSKIEPEATLWTVWRLIDENRLFLDEQGHIVLKKPTRAGE